MDGLTTSEQALFADSVKRFATREYGFGPAPHRLGFDRARFAKLAETGILALAVGEEFGGVGGPLELVAAMRALAPALAPEPVVESGVKAAHLLRAAAAPALSTELLPDLVCGRKIAVVADLEGASRYDHAAISTSAVRSDAGYRLVGEKPLVPFGGEADHLIVSAKLEGTLALFVVPSSHEGVSRSHCPRIDGMPAADIAFSDCRIDRRFRLDAAPVENALSRASDLACMGQLAEMCGLMYALTEATIEYACTRRQFGTTIAGFQALQHRIVDMWIACEEAASMMFAAAHACLDDGASASRAISLAKLVVGDGARLVGNDAIQIHGGIGMSDELIVSHWYRRLWALRLLEGDRQHHLARLRRPNAPAAA